MLHETIAVREAVRGPLRHLVAAQQSVACGGKADIEFRFFGIVAARLFPRKKDFVGRPHATPIVLLSAMPHRTAHSRTKYDERYYR
jgi:hypothetical protein